MTKEELDEADKWIKACKSTDPNLALLICLFSAYEMQITIDGRNLPYDKQNWKDRLRIWLKREWKIVETPNKPNFTSGPWRMPPCCTIHMNKPAWDERYSPSVKSGADIVCGLSNVRVADAALIACAPEMYELLEQIMQEIEADELPVKDRPTTYIAIQKLLAKARGGTK